MKVAEKAFALQIDSMSTLALEKLPENMEALSTLIHEGQIVLLTEGARVVAQVTPPDETVRGGGRRLGSREFMAKYRADRQRRPEISVTAWLREERDQV